MLKSIEGHDHHGTILREQPDFSFFFLQREFREKLKNVVHNFVNFVRFCAILG